MAKAEPLEKPPLSQKGVAMKTVQLSQGYETLVTTTTSIGCLITTGATKNKLTVYGVRKVRTHDGRTTSQLLHRFILGVTDPEIRVDHEVQFPVIAIRIGTQRRWRDLLSEK